MAELRPGWDTYFLNIAVAVSSRADCTRRKVGAVVVRPDHTIVSTGYNGAASGGPSCLKGECPRGQMTYEQLAARTAYNTCVATHAEVNACLRASWDEMQGATLYCTDAPCGDCTKVIAASGIARVVTPEGDFPVDYSAFQEAS